MIIDNGVSYMYIPHNNVYLMTASRHNCNVGSLFVFLHRLVSVSIRIMIFTVLYFVDLLMYYNMQIFEHYFEKLEEESLRDNFVVVVRITIILYLEHKLVYIVMKMCNVFIKTWQYELLDEVMDFGYPQFTEAMVLSEFIKTDAYRMEVTQRPPMAVTNAVSWRNEGLYYKKNEVCISLSHS